MGLELGLGLGLGLVFGLGLGLGPEAHAVPQPHGLYAVAALGRGDN